MFFMVLGGFEGFGQSITVDDSTPFATCSNATINVNYSNLNGATGPYTIELIEKIQRFGQYCEYINTTSIVSVSSITNSVSLAIPSVYTQSERVYCTPYGGGTLSHTYSIRVSGSNGIKSSDFPIDISSVCNSTMGFKVLSSTACQGKQAIVNWISQGANSGNIFTFELSDEYGDFSNPIMLGTAAVNNSDGVKNSFILIPANLSRGNDYKLKLKSSSPISEKITTAFEIGVYAPSINGSNKFCGGSSISLFTNSNYDGFRNYSFVWKKNGNTLINADTTLGKFLKNNAIIADSGNYTVTKIRNTDGCSAVSQILAMSILNPPTITATPNPVIYGTQTTLSATGCAGRIRWYAKENTPDNAYIYTGSTLPFYSGDGLRENNIYYSSCYDIYSGCYTTKSSLAVNTISSNAPPIPILAVVSSSSEILSVTATGCTGTITWSNSFYGWDYISFGYGSEGVSVDGYTYTFRRNKATFVNDVGQNYPDVMSGTIYAECTQNSLKSLRASVPFTMGTATVTPCFDTSIAPPTVTSDNGTNFRGNSVILTASGCGNNYFYAWYTSTSTSPVFKREPEYFTHNERKVLFNVRSDITYYVACESIFTGCRSSKTSVTVLVGNDPVLPICPYQTFSTKSGNWNDPTVWSCNTIPDETQNVTIKSGHTVTVLNTGGIQKCKNIRFELNGNLVNNGNLLVANQ